MSDPERPHTDAKSSKVVARWEGTIKGRGRQYATREPGGFGSLLSTPNWVKTVTVSVVLREEIDVGARKLHTVVESIDWAAQVDDLYYQNKDGSTVPAGVGAHYSVRFTEEELARDPDTADTEYLRRLESYVDEAREQVRNAAQKKKAAVQKTLSATKPAKEMTGAAELEAALEGLRRALARGGERDENSDRAHQAFHDAFTPVTNELQAEFQADLERLTAEYYASLGRIDPVFAKVFANPEATEAKSAATAERIVAVLANPEAKSAATVADNEYRTKTEEATARRQAVYNWYYARFEMINADSALAQARVDLRRDERRLAEAKAKRVLAATANAGIRVEPHTGRRIAFVEYALSETDKLNFPVDIAPLTLAEARSMDIRTDPSRESEPTIFTGSVPILGWGFKGEAETSTAQAVVKYSESKRSGEPGLIGGGESEIEVTFTRKPEPMRYEASVATVSEIPPYSLPALDMLGVQLFEQVWGRWSPDWVDEYGNYTESTPLDAAFSDRKHYRFMHVLSAFVETADGATITHGDFLPMGPNGEQTSAGASAIVVGAREFKPLASSMKMTVDGVEVMIFEQAYGAQARAADLSTTVSGWWFPPIWTSLRIGISADGRRVREMFDRSYFPQHFVFDEGVYRTSTIEDPVAWGHYGWDKLEEGPTYFMFDPAGAEAWWRENAGVVIEANKGSAKGNPWSIENARPLFGGDEAGGGLDLPPPEGDDDYKDDTPCTK